MVWGAFSVHGALPLQRVRQTLTSQVYLGILNDHVAPFFDDPDHAGYTFQQDNATAHTARRVTTWFEEQAIPLLPWPACSPDLNPIENCWQMVKHQLDEEEIHGFDQLFQRGNELFQQLGDDYLSTLIDSMPQRCAAVIAANGGHTTY